MRQVLVVTQEHFLLPFGSFRQELSALKEFLSEDEVAFYSLLGVSCLYLLTLCTGFSNPSTFYSLLGVSTWHLALPDRNYIVTLLSTPFWEFRVHGLLQPLLGLHPSSYLSTPFWEFRVTASEDIV